MAIQFSKLHTNRNKYKKIKKNNMGSLEKLSRIDTVIMYGNNEAETLTKNISDTIPSGYQTEAKDIYTTLQRGELVQPLETKRQTKKENIIDVLLTNSKLTDNKGNFTKITITERDITERNKSKIFLKEKIQELDDLREGQIALSEIMRGEQIIEHLGQSILGHLVPFTNAQIGIFYLVSDDNKLQRINSYGLSHSSECEKMIKFNEGLVGQVAYDKHSKIIENIPKEYFHKIESPLGAMVPKSLLIFPILYENNVNGVIELGSIHQFSENKISFLNHVSENIGIVINSSNVRKKMQELLEQSQTLNAKLQTQQMELNKAQILLQENAYEAQKGSQYKTQFLANMSHEIRTPLAAVLAFANRLCEEDIGHEERKSCIGTVRRSGGLLLTLIEDILDLSKIEAGQLNFENEEFKFSEMLADLKSILSFKAQENNTELLFILPKNTSYLYISDVTRLKQILINIIGNALKFSPKGKVFVNIELDIGVEKDLCSIIVSDNGIGMTEDQSKLLFQTFTQADASTRRNFGGTGLGLVISKKIAKALGGDVSLQKSQLGKGTSFKIEIPLTKSPNIILNKPKKYFNLSPKIIKAKLNGKSILVVDDSQDNLTIIEMLLKDYNLKLDFVESGYEALKKIEKTNFDLVLMDIQMPLKDGHETTQEMRHKGFNRPIIALTAHAFKAEHQKCFTSGHNYVITKPIDRIKLINILANYL